MRNRCPVLFNRWFWGKLSLFSFSGWEMCRDVTLTQEKQENAAREANRRRIHNLWGRILKTNNASGRWRQLPSLVAL